MQRLAIVVGLGLGAYGLFHRRELAEAMGWLLNGENTQGVTNMGESNLKLPRGIRNNNPGNIELTNPPTPWNGWVGYQGQTDGRYVQFETPEQGIRALARVLLNYQRLHGLRTITQIINRWAPSVENNTAAYVASVSKQTGFAATERLNLELVSTMHSLATAIIWHENGQQPYTFKQVQAGVASAY